MKNNPYIGPRPYKLGEKNFFGRDREARELLWLILAERVVLFYARSGAGKTSLLNAKTIPELTEKGIIVLPVARVGTELPPGIIADAVRNVFVSSALLDLTGTTEPQSIVNLTLTEYLEQSGQVQQTENKRRSILMILDQFEELFTTHRDRWKDVDDFFVQAREALDNHPDLKIIFALREDNVAELDPYLVQLPNQLLARFRMELLSTELAQESIEKPAKAAGCQFEKDAAAHLSQDLSQIKMRRRGSDDQVEFDSIPGPYVEPVQLQVVCQQLWDALPDSSECRIRIDEIERYGNIDHALTNFYQNVIQRATAEVGAQERQLRVWFSNHLITPMGTRGLVMQGKSETAGLPNDVVEFLRSQHLVNAEMRGGQRWYELAHDRLIEPILRSNEAQRNPLQLRMVEWNQRGRPSDLLLHGIEFTEAERWVSENAPVLTQVEKDFMVACREAHTKAERELARQAELRINIADLGWGVIFAHDADPQIREALKELLDFRREQATQKHSEYYKEFVGANGYRPRETAPRFLERHGAGANLASPDRMPYYLLIVGSPQAIPFEFQYGLDVLYGVGRVYFDDLESYARYARSVVTVERSGLSLPPRAVLFCPVNPDSQAAALSEKWLVTPVHQQLVQSWPNWNIEAMVGQAATKAQLADLLGDKDAPTLLFTASHVMEFPKDDPYQLTHTGALVCQDWPGPSKWREALSTEHCFSADDIIQDARLLGLIAFFFGGPTAGEPEMDDFALDARESPKPIAPHAFLSRLPQRLLGHPNGGALAVIGHVERNWSYSFSMPGGRGRESRHFADTLVRLMMGHTIGSAVQPFNQRYTLLSSQLSEVTLKEVVKDNYTRSFDWSNLAKATTDARNYVVIGDPAVRLPVNSASPIVERPVIEPVVF